MKTVVIRPCAGYSEAEVRPALEALLAPLGSLSWVEPGMRVAVKANLVVGRAPARAATTHPALVRELCRRLTARGASVVVGDSPGGPYSRTFLDMVYRATEMTKVTDTGAALRAAEIQADVLMMAKNIDAIYDSDPKKNPNAKKYSEISYIDYIKEGLTAMDTTAVSLCMDNKITIVAFGLHEENSIVRVLNGEKIGTTIHA